MFTTDVISVLRLGHAESRRKPWLGALLFLSVVTSAYERGGPALSEVLNRRLSPTSVSRCRALTARHRVPSGVEVKLRISAESISPGQSLGMDLNVRNRGITPVKYWRSGQRWDFWVKGPKGLVWIWSQVFRRGGDFQAIVREKKLAPGQSRDAARTWRHEDCSGASVSLEPGTYTARAIWAASPHEENAGDGGWWSNPVEFEIRG